MSTALTTRPDFLRLVVSPALGADGTVESIRKAASKIPGYGQPDVYYPEKFRGRWKLRREVVNVTPGATEYLLNQLKESQEIRFIEYGDHVVQDKTFPGGSSWTPENPNFVEDKLSLSQVTKRSFEEPSPNTFGSSEYSRVTLNKEGPPEVFAERVQRKWRWEEDEERVEGIEILTVYDLTGNPQFVAKSRLQLYK